MDKGHRPQTSEMASNGGSSSVDSEDSGAFPSSCSIDRDVGLVTCRVCQCNESDARGDDALLFLGIVPPLPESGKISEEQQLNKNDDSVANFTKAGGTGREYGFMEFISPTGKVFVCNTDIEAGSCNVHDSLVELGCSCKNDLALVHYACALKWFVNRGSSICEICGSLSKNVRTDDIKKVIGSLMECEALRERTLSGQANPAQLHTNSGIDPDAVAAVRRQRLSEISLWFGPRSSHNNFINNSATVPEVASDQHLETATESAPAENPATRWVVEGTGILLTTGLLTLTLVWIIAPRVGKGTAKTGLRILLGGVCALAIVLFFRIVVLTKMKYGPARYWAILFVSWFLVFGIWASRTQGARTK